MSYIDAFVGHLDLKALGFIAGGTKVRASNSKKNNYNPKKLSDSFQDMWIFTNTKPRQRLWVREAMCKSGKIVHKTKHIR